MCCSTRSTAGTCWTGRGRRCAATAALRYRPGQPGAVEEYGVSGCSTSWPRNCGRDGTGHAGPAGVHPKPGTDQKRPLSGAPFGYRYVRKTDLCGAAYEVIEGEAVLVAEMFRRYADDGAAIADLARWLTGMGVATRTGKHRWDRSVIWAMLRNPAYAGTAVFGKTMAVHDESPGLNRVARLQGRSVPRAVKTVDRPRGEWLEIPVPAIVTAESFARVAQRLEGNKRFAARNTKVPSLLQGLAACSACGYGYYRTSARTTSRKIYYYRCLAATTTATKAAGSAATSRSAPTTSTMSCGTTSPACSPTRR